MTAPPRMSAGCTRRAMAAIADELSDQYPGIEVVVDDGRVLPPGAKRLRPALDKRKALRDNRELRPAAGRRDDD